MGENLCQAERFRVFPERQRSSFAITMTHAMVDYTIDELISVCIAPKIGDEELVAQGIATPLVLAGYLLAKRTHAPGVLFCSAIGQGLVQDWAPLAVAGIEALWLDRPLNQVGFARAATEVLP